MERCGENCEIDYVSPQDGCCPGTRRAGEGHCISAGATRLCECGELHCGGRCCACIGSKPYRENSDAEHATPVQRSTAVAASPSPADFLRWAELSGPCQGIEDGG